MQLGSVYRGLEALAQAGITEQLGNFREDFQVLLRGGFRHQQKDQQADRHFVRRIKTDGLQQLKYRRHGRLQPFDAPVGNGHTMSEPRRSESLPGKQAVCNKRPRKPVLALEEQPRFFKSTLFAGGVHAHKDLSGGEDRGESVHGHSNNYAHTGKNPE